mgnify:CR=1 FL=1
MASLKQQRSEISVRQRLCVELGRLITRNAKQKSIGEREHQTPPEQTQRCSHNVIPRENEPQPVAGGNSSERDVKRQV